jgi:hypothetical protein
MDVKESTVTVVNSKIAWTAFLIALIVSVIAIRVGLFIGIGSLKNAIVVFFVFPVVLSLLVIGILSVHGSKGFSWAFLLCIFLLVGSEVLSHMRYSAVTGINVFNDFPTGSVGILVIFIQLIIAFIALRLFGNWFGGER